MVMSDEERTKTINRYHSSTQFKPLYHTRTNSVNQPSNAGKQTDIIQRLDKEVFQAKYINSQLIISQRKREEMIAFVLEENRKLRA